MMFLLVVWGLIQTSDCRYEKAKNYNENTQPRYHWNNLNTEEQYSISTQMEEVKLTNTKRIILQ